MENRAFSDGFQELISGTDLSESCRVTVTVWGLTVWGLTVLVLTVLVLTVLVLTVWGSPGEG
jgi:hypothetical protein